MHSAVYGSAWRTVQKTHEYETLLATFPCMQQKHFAKGDTFMYMTHKYTGMQSNNNKHLIQCTMEVAWKHISILNP